MKVPRPNGRALAASLTAAAIGLGAVATAGDLAPVLAAERSKIELAQASQQRIDQVVSETQDLDSEYKRVMKEVDGLKIYNDYLERQIANQIEELAELRRSIDQVSSIERQIVPLMLRMMDGLDKFVELDVPFLLEERRERVARLRGLMERADVSAAEKFRRLTEAFQVENDFGRTIEAYKGNLAIDGASLEVNLLRIGRVGLYYQTNDASVTGMWDVAARSWVPLEGGRSRDQVRRGLRIARKQVAPDLLLLPIPAPEDAS